LMDEVREMGTIRLTTDLSDLPSGLYFYRIQKDKEEFTRKLLVQ
jgi:hypothetical protein